MKYLLCVLFAVLFCVFAHANDAMDGLPPPRVLAITQWDGSRSLVRQLKRIGTEVTSIPILYRDQEMHHLCDKPLEEGEKDKGYVESEGRAFLDQHLANLDAFDLVITQLPATVGDKDDDALTAIYARLVPWVQAGGRLIVVNPGWETTFEGTPLETIIPVRFERHRAWATGVGTSSGHSFTRGLPTEILGTHFYGPVYLPADESCIALTINEQAGFWYRPLAGGGQIAHLFAPGGQRWPWVNGTHYSSYAADRPDDSTVWTDLWRRLVYGLVYGDRATPVLIGLNVPEQVTEGSSIEATIENRGETQVSGSLILSAMPRTADHRVQTQPFTLAPGETRSVQFSLPAEISNLESYLHLRVAVADADGTLLGRADAWPTLGHRVPVAISVPTTARTGEWVTANIELPAGEREGDYTLLAGICDRLGNLYQVQEQALTLRAGEAQTTNFVFSMPDGGFERMASYWPTAVILHDRRGDGLARAQIQLDEPWDMRDQLQFSVWTAGGDGDFMTLLQDAGFNSLGFPGNSRLADQYGMRQYVEGSGINTFGVTIDHDNWADVRAEMVGTLTKLNEKEGPDARSKALVSLGEESGFKGGWGRRYYWDEPQAPPLVQKVFADYLRERYDGDLARLNAEWGSAFATWETIPLEKEKVRAPRQVFVGAEAWEAMATDKREHSYPVTFDQPDPTQRYLARSAPYYETHFFFDWYYQRYCDLTTEVYRELRNPVPRTIMSAPGGFYPKVDVYNFGGQGPFYPKEGALLGNAVARRDYGDGPGFSGAAWLYFDLRALWECSLMSSLAVGNTHIDYWVDQPLTFNPDTTHTRASFWNKVLVDQLRPIAPILLQRRFAYTPGLGIFVPPQPLAKGIGGSHFGASIGCNAPVYGALEKSGMLPRVVAANNLADIRVLVASYAQVIDDKEAGLLSRFVERGGTLITTPWFGMCSPHGNALSVYPEGELATLLGFRLLNTSQQPWKKRETATFEWPGAGEITLESTARDTVQEMSDDVQIVARYADGEPFVLVRKVGQGQIIHLNAVYDWQGWWTAFYQPGREAYRRFLSAAVREAGVTPEFTVTFQSYTPSDANVGWHGMRLDQGPPKLGEAIPWWGSQAYSAPGGGVHYLMVFADHRSPLVTADVTWTDTPAIVYDLLKGEEMVPVDGKYALTLQPGEAAFLAACKVRPAPLKHRLERLSENGVRLTLAVPPGIERGVWIADDRAGRSYWLKPGQQFIDLPVADNRPAEMQRRGVVGRFWQSLRGRPEETRHLTITDSLTRQRFEEEIPIGGNKALPSAASLSPFPPRADEQPLVTPLSGDAYLAKLRQLTALYLTEHKGLEAKYQLSRYLYVAFRPENRQALVRDLLRSYTPAHQERLLEAVRNGESFVLLLEDANRDPLTGFAIDPLAAPGHEQLADLVQKDGRLVDNGGYRFRVLEVGSGKLILGLDSIDRACYTSEQFAAWHTGFLQALRDEKWID